MAGKMAMRWARGVAGACTQHLSSPKNFFRVVFNDDVDHISDMALVAQLDRASVYETEGCTFEPC